VAILLALTVGHSMASDSADVSIPGMQRADVVELVEREVTAELSLAGLPSGDDALTGIVEAPHTSFGRMTPTDRALVYAATTRQLLAARGSDASFEGSEASPASESIVAANEAPRTGIVAVLCLVLSVALLGAAFARGRTRRPQAVARPASSSAWRIGVVDGDTIADGALPADSRGDASEAAAVRTNRVARAAQPVRTGVLIDAERAVVTAAAGQGALSPVVFDPTHLLGGVVAEWRAEAALKGVTLGLNVGSLPWRVVADAQRLRTVIDHTLRAVVRGTSATRVQIEVDADVTATRLRVVVRDDRPPAPVEADAAVATPADLASALARGLATAMGGTYRLRTSSGGDTLCRIVIPYACADAEDAARLPVAPGPRHASPSDAVIVQRVPVRREDVAHALLDAPIMQAIETRLGGAAGRRLAVEFMLSLGELVRSARESFAADDRASLEATLQTMAGLAETYGCLPIVAAVRASRTDPSTARFGRVLTAISEAFPTLSVGNVAASNESDLLLNVAA
jgi:hypothetical protein